MFPQKNLVQAEIFPYELPQIERFSMDLIRVTFMSINKFSSSIIIQLIIEDSVMCFDFYDVSDGNHDTVLEGMLYGSAQGFIRSND